MKIIIYEPTYAREITDLFHDTVHKIACSHYTKEQTEAWAPAPPDYKKWSQRFQITRPYVAVKDAKVLGFIELEKDGHIGCLYTHKDHQRCGVAKSLYLHVEEEAKRQGIKWLYVDASHMAKPFFERQNFQLVRENTVRKNGVNLTNFSMRKQIAP